MAKSGQHGGNVSQMAQRFGVDPKMVVDFSANINPLGLPASLKSALIAEIEVIEHYPDIEYHALHQAIAKHIGCPVNYLLAGNGATELIFLWAHYFRPRKALLVEPSFAEYRRALTRYQCAIETFRLSEAKGLALSAELLNALTPDLDCLFLCTPNNPTGLMPDSGLLLQIIAKCRALNIALFIDESFIDFLPGHKGCAPWLADNSHLYLLRSMTKFYAMPGLRLGYLLSADTALLTTIREQREPWTINALAALAAPVVLNDNEYAKATYRWLAEQQKALYRALAALPQLTVYPPSANYILIKLNHATFDLQEALMAHHILIRHCANYSGLSAAFYRVAIKSAADNQTLINALHEVFRHG